MKLLRNLFILILFAILGSACDYKQNSLVKPQSKHQNYLKNTNWVIANDRLIGIEPGDSEYQLSLKSDTAQMWNYSAVEFQNDKNFTSYNSWECGNDCFTATFGTYEFTGINEIKFETDSITTAGTCDAPTKIFKDKMEDHFQIRKKGDQIVLKRLK